MFWPILRNNPSSIPIGRLELIDHSSQKMAQVSFQAHFPHFHLKHGFSLILKPHYGFINPSLDGGITLSFPIKPNLN